MLPDFAISGTPGWLILSLPYVLLLLTWVVTQRGSHGARTTVRTEDKSHSGADHADAGPDEQGAASVRNYFSNTTGYPSFPSPVQKTLERRSVPDARVSDVSELARDTEKTDLDSIKAEIADALAAKDQAALGQLYLTQGVLLKRDGQSLVAGDVLRKSVMIAMQLKDARLHALGRLELGDVVAEAGDLTTACEHWQMAKRMFLEVRHRSDSEAADERMLEHGCPTEWVLTEF